MSNQEIKQALDIAADRLREALKKAALIAPVYQASTITKKGATMYSVRRS